MARLAWCIFCILGLWLTSAAEFDVAQYALRYWKNLKGIMPEVAYPEEQPGANVPDKMIFYHECVAKFAPHWLEEYKAIDKAFGWKEGTYLGLCVYGQKKKKVEPIHECTSWIVCPELTGKNEMYLHKSRDSRERRLAVQQIAVKGKHAWLGMGSPGYLITNFGINDAGLAIAMNAGNRTPDEKYEGLRTSAICRILLEECATVAEAVKLLETIVKEGAYTHRRSGSIWFFADGKDAIIVEHNAKHFQAAPIRKGIGIRANSWKYPEMLKHSISSVADYLCNDFKENVVFRLLVEQCYYSKYSIGLEDVWAVSRNREMGLDGIYPLCGNLTNSAATFSIDIDFPSELSTAWIACGPPRHTVYIPVPITISSLPDALMNGDFGDAAFARFDKNGLDVSVKEYVMLEKKMKAVYDEAHAKAKALLKNGGSKREAAKLLEDAFLRNWKMMEECEAMK